MCNIDQCYFVVWAPDSVHIERIQRDSKVFSECLKSIDKLLVQAILPEVIGCYFTKPRAPCTDNTDTNNAYCYCKGPDDGSKMIMCENLQIRQAPKGSWFCSDCSKETLCHHEI